MSILSLTSTAPTAIQIDPKDRESVVNEVIDLLTAEFKQEELLSPTPATREKVTSRVGVLVPNAFRKRNLRPDINFENELVAEIARRLMGYGFLDLLLPPIRTDLTEVAIYSSGLVQVMRKGSVRFETVPLRPDAREVNRVLDRILGPQNRSLNEANPTVRAKLPRTKEIPGGGRVQADHPCIAPPGICPAINIRLFEPEPVLPHWLLERGAMSAEMMEDLREVMETGRRLLIGGGTRTGKTTLLSALCNFLPKDYRILKIEDPEEIWIARDTVQTLEARPRTEGTNVRDFSLRDGVDDALRMSPDYLVIGEVRDGNAANALFRGLMTGHSGACTFHADTPAEAAHRLGIIMAADAGVGRREAADTIASAVDVYLQIGIRNDRRRVISISNVAKKTKDGSVWFEHIWRFDEAQGGNPAWKKVGELASHYHLSED